MNRILIRIAHCAPIEVLLPKWDIEEWQASVLMYCLHVYDICKIVVRRFVEYCEREMPEWAEILFE